MAKLYVESELQHHGVKGMRWGHRKVTTSGGKSSYLYKSGSKTSKKYEEKDYTKAANEGKGSMNKKTFDALQYKSKKVTDQTKKNEPVQEDASKTNNKPKLNKNVTDGAKTSTVNQPKQDNKQNDDALAKKEYERVNTNLRATGKIATESGKIMNATKQAVDNIPVKKQRMDLSNMSDKELQDAINRELKERQYNDLFAQPSKAEKGKQIASGILSGAGAVLAVTGSALSIALAIREFKKKPGEI